MKRSLFAFISLIIVILLLVGCASGDYEKGYKKGYDIGYEIGLKEGYEKAYETDTTLAQNKRTQTIDNPLFSDEEVSTIIWSKLALKLPKDYDVNQFDPDTRNAQYEGSGKWKFKVNGSGESRKELPIEIAKESDILWIYYEKEEVTTYDLLLEASYYEKLRDWEILQIDKYNIVTTTHQKSETPREARLKVNWYRTEYLGGTDGFRFSGSVTNTGIITINGGKVVAYWGSITREAPLCITDLGKTIDTGSVFRDQNAVFSIEFNGTSPDIPYPDDFIFVTGDGNTIIHELDLNWVR